MVENKLIFTDFKPKVGTYQATSLLDYTPSLWLFEGMTVSLFSSGI